MKKDKKDADVAMEKDADVAIVGNLTLDPRKDLRDHLWLHVI